MLACCILPAAIVAAGRFNVFFGSSCVRYEKNNKWIRLTPALKILTVERACVRVCTLVFVYMIYTYRITNISCSVYGMYVFVLAYFTKESVQQWMYWVCVSVCALLCVTYEWWLVNDDEHLVWVLNIYTHHVQSTHFKSKIHFNIGWYEYPVIP